MTRFKYDILSGFSVFMLALPLCLGIAMASNFPPIAGVFTAIIGGIVSTFIGSSRLTIKGPAAGLIIIVVGAVNELGGGDLTLGYKRALAVGVVAALIQIVIALSKKAVIAEIMPPSVIHGMLSAIGVIIIAKQSYVMMGTAPTAKKPLAMLAALPSALLKANPLIFALAIGSLLTALLIPRFKKLSFIPAALAVLCVAIPFSYFFGLTETFTYSFMGKMFSVGPQYLIRLPDNIFKAMTFPDFSVIFSPTSLKYIAMYALIGSIESLLTVCAVDTMDPEKKRSDLNKDLFSVGIGNLIASCIGGLPMISEIVRSKANVDYGAKSRYANFFHGFFLFIAILILPTLMQRIPLAALAALLVLVGTRLASPKEFSHVYKIGTDQFFIFCTTFVVTLVEDLLVGVAVGLVLKLILHLVRGVHPKEIFKTELVTNESQHEVEIKVSGALVFTNYLTLKDLIFNQLQSNKNVILNLSDVSFVDHTIVEKLHQISVEISPEQFQVKGMDDMKRVSNHPLAVHKAR